MQPSVYRKAAIRKGPRPTVHWRDFVQRRTREEYDLVLLGNNRLIAARANRRIAALSRVVETQIASLELARFTMEKIYERHPPRCDPLLRIVAMRAEEVSLIAGRNLHFGPCNMKLFHPQLLQYAGKYQPNTIKDYFLMRPQIHQHSRTAMVVIGHSGFAAGRNYFAGDELIFASQSIANKLLHFLRRQEFVQHDTLGRNGRR